MNCYNCNVLLLPEAKFCHNCGVHVKKDLICSQCKASNPFNAKFCYNCGYNMAQEVPSVKKSSKDLFLEMLDLEIRAENGYSKSALIKSRFLSTPYKNIFDARFQQLDYDLLTEAFNNAEDNSISSALFGLMEFFLVMYCQDLLPFKIDEKVLKYDSLNYAFDLQQMAEDYLELSTLNEDISYAMVDIDFDKLENASKNFFSPSVKEHLVFMLDLSIAGNLKHGLAVTDTGIYWKLPFQTSCFFAFKDIEKLEIQTGRLLINSKYLDVDAKFNFRLRRFLQRMMLMSYTGEQKRDA